MRLREFHAEAFGPFTDLSLDFSARSHGLHFFFGPNEAGKSSLQRALENFFYGIPHRSKDDFLHSKTKLRLRAVLEDLSGTSFDWTRRKGNKHTLLDCEGKGVDEEALNRILGHLSQDQFSMMFALNRSRLEQGGREMMSGGGTLGPSLFQAGTGRMGLQKLLEGFESQAGQIYRDRGEIYPLNQSLKALEAAKKEMRDTALSTDTWFEKQNQLKQAREESNSIKETRKRVEKRWRHLQRLKQAKPLFIEIERLEKVAPKNLSLNSLPLVRDLRQREAIAAAREKDWKQRQARWRHQYQSCQEQSESITDTPSLDLLKAVLSDAGEIRDLERRIQESREESKREGTKLEARFNRLNPSQKSIEILSRQTLPCEAALQALEEEDKNLQIVRLDLQRERERLARRLVEWEKTKQVEEAQAYVPSEQDLLDSRELRDQCWQALYQEVIVKGAPEEKRERMAQDYLGIRKKADGLSDVLRLEADRVATRAQRLREKGELDLDYLDLCRREKEMETRQAQWNQRWQELWLSFVPQAGSVKMMTTFFTEVQQIQGGYLKLQQNEAQSVVWVERLTHLSQSLSEVLRSLNLVELESDLSISSQLALGEKFLSDAEKKMRQQQKVYQTLLSLQQQEEELLAEKEDLEREREAWSQLRKELPSGDLQTLETQLTELERLEALRVRLKEISGGMDLSLLRQEALAYQEEQFVEVEEELDELSEHLTGVDQRVGTLEAELRAMRQEANEGRAAQAAQEEAMQAERVRQLSSRYAVLKTATLVLQRAVDRYRERHEGPLLRRASEIFAQITCGAFSGLRSSFDDQDRAVLLGIRTSGVELGVDEMSDGTAEQLFLALRIASIESYVDQHQSMPVFLDDTLLDSDQERCEQILLVLNALAQKTQVFLFSHHRYLLDLAKKASLTELVEHPLK